MSKFLNFSNFFLLVMMLVQNSVIFSKYLTYGQAPDDAVHLKLVSVENETENQEFQLFYNYDSATAFVAANSTFEFVPDKQIKLMPANLLVIKCCKGSYVPVFVQDGGSLASGKVQQGYQGPFFISMWLSVPNTSESNKIRVRYMVKEGSVGEIGIRIGKKGDYRLVAHNNVIFME
jgi:hypothetical protein